MRRLILPAVALTFLVAGRKPDDPRHENHYSAPALPAVEGMELQLAGAHAQQEFIQVDVKMANTTSDRLLILKKGEAAFTLPDGQIFKPVPTTLFGMGGNTTTLPNDIKSHTFKVDGAAIFHVSGFSLVPAAFSWASNTGTPVAAPDFALPATTNVFTAGPWSCTLKKAEQKTDRTRVDFHCLYNGKGVGLVEPARIALKVPSGQTFANQAEKVKRDIVHPGGSAKFLGEWEIEKKVVDMQFAQLQVVWGDTFADSALTPVVFPEWTFTLDAAATEAANK